MQAFRYKGKDGNTAFTVSSSIPGLTIVPPGRTLDDAEPMTNEEFDAEIKRIKEHNEQNPYKDPRDEMIESLGNQVKQLQADMKALKDKRA